LRYLSKLSPELRLQLEIALAAHMSKSRPPIATDALLSTPDLFTLIVPHSDAKSPAPLSAEFIDRPVLVDMKKI
jgi:hypothetical protein